MIDKHHQVCWKGKMFCLIIVLFNKCLKEGIFPQSFKLAQVTPLFKGGDREDPSCYRPISLLPALGKLLEKIVSVRVIDYLDHNNLISNCQFGFRKKLFYRVCNP